MGWRSPRRLDKLRGGNNNINGIQKSLLCLCLYVCVYDPCEINCVGGKCDDSQNPLKIS